MSERDYDLVLLGATGFTGSLVARHLADRMAGSGRRWAIAGRRGERLREIAAELDDGPDVEVVDVHDLVGLLDLAERTRVVATTVGPFAQHGELVAQACARRGAHYADITGEPGYVDLLEQRYDADARRRGVRLVPCCGFDSVPHDLGAWWTVQHLPDDAPIELRAYVRVDGRFSGGTAHTALDAIGGGLAPTRLPDRSADDRRVRGLPMRVHFAERLGAYGVPLPTVDPAIVRRSALALADYGPDFAYGHYAQVRRRGTVAAGLLGAGAVGALARLGPTRALLRRALPDPGTGPDEARRARSRFQVTFVAETPTRRLVTRVSGGDPGYDETARMLGEAALQLADDPAPTEPAGLCTPAVGLGAPYQRRLEEVGMRFEVLDDQPLAAAPARAQASES